MRRKQPSTNTVNSIRIIGGEWRGRRLAFPDADGLRPTGNRIRETLFNWLAPEIVGLRALDLFSGSGALGLEALSRGARQVDFVENNTQVCHSLQGNLDLLFAANARIYQESAELYLRRAQPGSVDLVFVDPPFQSEIHNRIALLIERSQILQPGGLVYVESAKAAVLSLPDRWQSLKAKTSGQVRFQLFRVN